ncbi:hypothetical protein KIW84_072077 [Lathyrus oleraceus]|uniref:Prohibitin n=1 Tax=Pisum sativum TaxID=3888 RepID=A0A9D4VL90_PEA|nr:hypothetical protein KIW84_072077 [Pisum sativum]
MYSSSQSKSNNPSHLTPIPTTGFRERNFNNVKIPNDPGSRIVASFKMRSILKERLLLIPWFKRNVIHDGHARLHSVESTSGNRDLQMVKTGLRILIHPVPDQFPSVYPTLGDNYSERPCLL